MRVLIVLVLLLFVAAVLDFYKGKIPNVLTLTGCCYGLVRMVWYQEILKFIPGILLPVVVLFPVYKIGGIGAGDVKLFAMLGFYFTFRETVFCIWLAFVLGAVISVISFIRYKNFMERMTYLFSYLKDFFLTGYFQHYYSNFNKNQNSDFEEYKSKIHLAIPIFLSVLFYVGGGVL